MTLLSANPTKLLNTLKQFRLSSTNCLSVLDHFVELALKGLIHSSWKFLISLQNIYVFYYVSNLEITKWISCLQPSGGFNLLNALKKVLKMKDVDSVTMVVGNS